MISRQGVLGFMCKAAWVFLVYCVFLSARPANADEDTLRCCCSYQLYDALLSESAQSFSKSTGVKVDLSPVSSPTAYRSTISGLCDIGGLALRGPPPSTAGFEKSRVIPFCEDGLAIIAHEKTAIGNIPARQLRDLFAGDIMNWKQIGGMDLPVVRVVPDPGTGAYRNFESMVMWGSDIICDVMTRDSTMVIEIVKHLPGSVSFIGQGATVAQHGIRTIRVNNQAPTDKRYPYRQTYYLVLPPEPRTPAKQLVDFILSEEGTNIMKQRGMVPIPREALDR